MLISVKGFIYHKTAEKYIDCFDRYRVNEYTNKFAISDGVSKSFFPDVWAELLVEFFTENRGRVNIAEVQSYRRIQSEWLKRVGEIVSKPNQKYFVRNFFIEGRPAAATFAGLHLFRDEGKNMWEAMALGDSFLFFVPKDINIDDNFHKITYLSSKSNFEFDNYPDFFDSRNVVNKGKIKQKIDELKPGTFYLMTDALSEWFLSNKQRAIDIINKWQKNSDFENDIIELRKLDLQNDDSAILIITVEDDGSLDLKYESVLISDISELINTESTIPENEVQSSKIELITDEIIKKIVSVPQIATKGENQIKLSNSGNLDKDVADSSLNKLTSDDEDKLKAEKVFQPKEIKKKALFGKIWKKILTIIGI